MNAQTAHTPRTNSAEIPAHYVASKYEDMEMFVTSSFARTLERENAQLVAEAKRLTAGLEWAISWAQIAIDTEESRGVKMGPSREWLAKHYATLSEAVARAALNPPPPK